MSSSLGVVLSEISTAVTFGHRFLSAGMTERLGTPSRHPLG